MVAIGFMYRVLESNRVQDYIRALWFPQCGKCRRNCRVRKMEFTELLGMSRNLENCRRL